MHVYNIFISHSWEYSSDYQNLIDLLNQDPYFHFKDYSVTEDDPLLIYNKEYYKSEWRNKITNQMKPCSVILIPAGVYASNSDSIAMEIEIAKQLEKPIVGILKWGAEKSSTIVQENATKIVKWNSSSIIAAIKEVAI